MKCITLCAVSLGCLSAIFAVSCHREQAQAPPPAPPVIPVSQPIQRDVTEFVDYTGRTDAVQSVGIRARVTGYLTKMPFKEGAEVDEGALLFEIDPRPYQALVDQAKGQLALNQAQLKLAQATYERDKTVEAKLKGTVTAQQLDQDKATVEQAEAAIEAAQAVLDAYKLNLSFTRVLSPIAGQVSRYYYTLGNLVNQDQTLLTTVVSVDPMYAYFDVDERTLLRVRTAINEGKIVLPKDHSAIPVLMGLEGEAGYPHEGTIDFVNNAVNPSTGTIAVRGRFANPKPKDDGRRLLVPGMFVRIRLPLGQPHPALLVADQALGSDQGLKFVYVVDDQNVVQYRRVTTGALQDDGLSVVEGVKATDWVVVGALQQVKPRMKVQPEHTPMPTFDTRVGGANSGAGGGRPQAPPAGELQQAPKTEAK